MINVVDSRRNIPYNYLGERSPKNRIGCLVRVKLEITLDYTKKADISMAVYIRICKRLHNNINENRFILNSV